jgi:hypothetical protein
MKKRLTLVAAAIVSSWLIADSARAADDKPRYERRWFYAGYNLQVDQSASELIALIERAAKAGYNGLVLADYKLNILDRVPGSYFKNAARVRAAAEKAHVEIVPAIFPIGYSNGLLAHDPNLAEGILVENAPFVVKERVALPVPDPRIRVVNGDLERTNADQFVGFSFQDDPGKASFADREVVHHGKVSCRMQDIGKTSTNGVCRLIQTVKVRPHACYRLSCWVKTRDLGAPGNFHITAIGTKGGRSLSFQEGGIGPTEDWKLMNVAFNSLDQSEVNVYAGIWGGTSGTLWIDELALEELSLVNVLRRAGCPLSVTSADGRATYVEGKDFEPVADTKLGRVPWDGEYEFRHEGPALRIKKGSRIKDGQRLRISWYHPIITHGEQVICCVSEPKVYDVLREQAMRVNDLFHAQTYLMSHDEIRVLNWCQACQSRKQTPGELLADNVRRCAEILKSVSPQAKVLVWSDMFDPNHNAVAQYYLVNGTLDGSWAGLEQSVGIANWNNGKAKESLRFFAERGHSQVIAGYYDVDDLSGFTTWDEAARGVPRVEGFMYTTWGAKYRLLEAYGKAQQRIAR